MKVGKNPSTCPYKRRIEWGESKRCFFLALKLIQLHNDSISWLECQLLKIDGRTLSNGGVNVSGVRDDDSRVGVNKVKAVVISGLTLTKVNGHQIAVSA